jgi:hypothetical protein
VFGVVLGAGGLFAALERERLPATVDLLLRGMQGTGLVVREPGPLHEVVRERAGRYELLALRLTQHDATGRTRGAPVRVLATDAFLPVVVTTSRPAARALAETRSRLSELLGESDARDWRAALGAGVERVVTGWTLEVDRSWRPRPLEPGELPLPLTRTAAEEGPTW